MKKLSDIREKLKKDKDDPCWKGYVQVGMKKKNGKEVPNCVPKESVEEEKDTHKTKDGRIAKKGLWYNINQKKKRGEAPAKKGDPDYPKTLDIEEKAVSQAQQKMMGMALAYKRGEMDDASPEVKKMANSMSMKDLEDFAKTKHKGLPVKKEVEEKAGVYSRYTASELKKKRDEREKRNAGTTQAQRIKNKMYGGMMGGLKKEEAELDEAITADTKYGRAHDKAMKLTDKAKKSRKIDHYVDAIKAHKEALKHAQSSTNKSAHSGHIRDLSSKLIMAEETELDEAFTPKEIKMAVGVASDKRYAGGNMTGAVNAIEKIKKGLSDHPQVKAVLRRQNESLDEAAPKLKGNDGPYTRQQIEKAAKEAKVDIGAKARMMMALRKV